MSENTITEQQTQANPLHKYFRQPKVWVKLPSHKGNFVPEEAINYTDEKKELAVYPMTAKDEILFQNPDALLNGEAVLKTIQSCVPQIKSPADLLKNDIDFLLAIIKSVSYETYDATSTCPSCRHENEFSLDLDTLINSTEFLDSVYPVNLDNGLTILVQPYSYRTTMKLLSIGFEESKFIRSLQDSSLDNDDRARMAKLSGIIESLSDLNFDVVADSVSAVIDEGEGVKVEDKASIREFIVNIDRESASKISKKVQDISEIGLSTELGAKCTNCGHEWEAELNFDPVTFFTKS